MNWSNIEIDHVKPIRVFDISNDEELRQCFKWKNTQLLLKEIHKLKGIKLNFLDYQLQFIKAYHFWNQMRKDSIKIFIDEIYRKPPIRNCLTNKWIYNLFEENWSIDLAHFSDYKTLNNKAFRYKFVIIDKFSKPFWATPLKSKNSQTLAHNFSKSFN